MKKLFITLMTIVLIGVCAYAESKGDELMSKATSSLAAKEYITARYLFLQSFNAYSAQNNYEKAVDAGVNATALYHRENYYKEAFDLLNKIDLMLSDGESKGKSLSAQRYKTAKERVNMYIKLKNSAKVKEWLTRMEELAKSNPSLNNDLLYTQANFYYTFGATSQGDAAINKLIQEYQNEKDYEKADKCYRQLIETATKTNNARLVARSYERYNQWTDSIRKITAADDLSKVQKQYDESLQIIADKDSSLSIKTGIIVTLGIVACILVAVLIFGAILLMRYIYLNRKLKKNIIIANEHNELKTQFIRNISAQMEPTLNTLDANLPAVKALKEFTTHIQELSDLENTLDEHYELTEQNVLTFCEKIADEIRPFTKSGVTIAVNAPKMGAKINAEELESVLLHLMKNAAEYTPENGKITLEFKKRGAHSLQFLVTDSGSGVAEEKVATLFKPFTEVHDLTKGDALGLPICALKVTKMNGLLSYDTSYTHGARFILDLHS